MIKRSDLGEEVTDAGLLIGLLKPGGDGGAVEFNEGWFGDPLAELESAGTRLDALVALLAAVLGPGASDPPPVFDGAQWLPIPNPANGAPTVFNLVVPPASAASGEMGLGVLLPFRSGDVTANAYVYVPLVGYGPSGARFIADGEKNPCRIGLHVTSPEPFQIQESGTNTVSFTALSLNANVYLNHSAYKSNQTPQFIKMEFVGLIGTNLPSTYTSLAGLLDPHVELWLLQVVIQASSWLSVYLGNTTYTTGDVLEAAGFLSRDYLLAAPNIVNLPSLVQKLTDSSSDPASPQVSAYLWSQFSAAQRQTLGDQSSTPARQTEVLLAALNAIIEGPSIYDETRFTCTPLSPETTTLLGQNPQGAALVRLNRRLLQDAYQLELAPNPYSLNLKNLHGSAADIALNFLFGALNALSLLEAPLVNLPGGGVYVTSRKNSDNSTDYGLRLVVDIPLTSDQSDAGQNGGGAATSARDAGDDARRGSAGDASQSSGGTPLAVNLCVGTWLTGETAANDWVARALGSNAGSAPAPGLSIFALHREGDNKLSFAPSFELVSGGLNIEGTPASPLFDLNGYTLKGAEMRANLGWGVGGWSYGGAMRLDNIGFPLGPNFGAPVHSTHTNPVAQSLLQSGSGTSSGAGGGGDQNPVNPTFSASAAYVEGGAFVVQLYDQSDQPAELVTIPIQRALGPLQCQSLGIGWVQDVSRPADDMLSLLFNGSITLAGLSVDLVGLSIGIPVATPTDFSKYDLDLHGLGITLSAGEVELSAALVKLPPAPEATPPRNYTEYDGEALLKAGTFVIAALGSYAYVPDHASGFTSLFIFGILDADLGGPGCFFVTGVAAGFGYNRALILPDQNSVTTFPLVAGASDPTKLGAQKINGAWQMPDPATALAKLDQFVPPQRGEYWLAAGVRFTSYDLINSTMLLVVEFGNELEIALLGLSWMSLPPPAAPGAEAPAVQYAYAELGIEIKLLPSEGVFSASAILTPNSFVIDPACKLTGGFAFYVWFGGNPHAGQFVLTLGGYHPAFTPPSYYPQVPRLGFNWPMPDGVSISGDAYFALTPSAVMAGAGLQILYSSGNLKAWFKAQMDALIEWAPFHYLIDISVSLGASYRVHFWFITFTLKVELGASLTLWGPPMGGKVHINWFIFSFTVGFGASQNDGPKPLDWTNADGTGFAQTLLPHRTQTESQTLTPMATMGAATDAATGGSVQPGGIYTITINSGLVGTFAAQNGTTVWYVRPNNFVFSAQTSIPTTEIVITPTGNEPSGTKTTFSPVGAGYYVCVRPMKATLSASVFTIGLQSDDDNAVYDLAGDFTFDLALAGVPAAKWGKPIPSGQKPEPNESLAGRLLGLTNITPKAPTLTPAGAGALDIDIKTAFTYDTVDEDNTDHLPLVAGQTPAGPVPHVDARVLHTIQTTLMNANVVTTRNAIYAALLSYGVAPATNGALKTLAGDPGAYLTGEPLLSVTPSPSANVPG